jgi:hypothetical protein
LAFFAVLVGEGEGLGVLVGLLLGEGLALGLVLGLVLVLGVGLSLELAEFVGVLLGELLDPGDWVAGGDWVGVVLGSGLGVAVGVALAAVILAVSVASALDRNTLAVARRAVVRPAVARLCLAATVVAGRVAQAAVTTAEFAPCVAATTPPNIPLLIKAMPATMPNIATPPGRWFTGLASVPPGCGLRWSPQLLTLRITEWTFPVVPIRHLRRQGFQWRRDDAGQQAQFAPSPGGSDGNTRGPQQTSAPA